MLVVGSTCEIVLASYDTAQTASLVTVIPSSCVPPMSMTLSTTGARIVVVVVPAVVVAAGLVVYVGSVVVGSDSDAPPQPATAMPTNADTSAASPASRDTGTASRSVGEQRHQEARIVAELHRRG